ncbi:hypothetical protein PWG71_12540 [Nocardiopsis sp. N85]|uniref:hypothetical protein n=1 Tax=Nocardiopsis sp. N85 TaxID=3029400 RepID=UPI00237F63E0|nr:hypothetical protein [Nocardiopsis sp. N85]MDE3722217.1 hypothetical protein [Nocardiopsis sp. N85]
MRPLDGTEGPGGGGKAEAARTAAREVASSAKDQVRSLAQDTRAETGHVMDDVQDQIRTEVGHLTGMASDHLRQWSQDLESMAEHGAPDSPVGGVVHRVAASGSQTADFLENRGVDGLLDEAGDLARRRPMVFLLGAAVAGFALGRLLKASSSTSQDEDTTAPQDTSERARSSAPLPRQGESATEEPVPTPFEEPQRAPGEGRG